jgi:hypothetical protein
MAKNKEIAEFKLDDGTPFLIEIQPSDNSSVERATNLDIDVVKAKQTFETALGQVIPVASAALERIRTGLKTPASDVELKFGVKLTAETGAIIASVGGEVNFEITLKWKQP